LEKPGTGQLKILKMRRHDANISGAGWAVVESAMMVAARSLLFGLALAGAASRGAAAPTIDTDVPFVTTPPGVTAAMLDIAKVGPRDFVIDLGSGDGRIVILAARRHGARGLGVELDPQLVTESRANAKKAGVSARAEFRIEDLYKTDLSRATVITMYLLPDVNLMLRPRLLELKPGTRIVSHDWDMGDWNPDASIVVPAPEKTLGIEKTSRVMLWTVPARIEGGWCSRAQRGAALTIRQKYQSVEGTLDGVEFSGTLSANALQSTLGAARVTARGLEFAKNSRPAGLWSRDCK
jgi:SAM-dependent methyltransferase